jgi:hypothetical protein
MLRSNRLNGFKHSAFSGKASAKPALFCLTSGNDRVILRAKVLVDLVLLNLEE